MFREIAQIILAINLSTSTVPDARVVQFAQQIQSRSVYVNVDPFMVTAIILHESQFNERAISGDQEDFGLMQIRARFYPGQKLILLEGIHNIKVGTHLIKLNKDMCRNFLKREPLTQEWFACYTGSCTKGGMCKPTKLTKKIEDYSLCLKDRVENGTVKNCKKIYWANIKD